MKDVISEYLKKADACNHLDNYNPVSNKYDTPNYLLTFKKLNQNE